MKNIKNITIAILVFIIRGYQLTLSFFIGRNCRFEPSCSQYAIDAIKKYGITKGIVKAIKRILKCRPGGGSGFDPA